MYVYIFKIRVSEIRGVFYSPKNTAITINKQFVGSIWAPDKACLRINV